MADACDVAESCDGVSNDCPVDLLAGVGTECRAAADQCDVAESCDGLGIACPADEVLDGVSCDDGSVCSGIDLCEVGICVGSGPLDCDDDDPCTADSCDGVSGCANDPIVGCVPPAAVPTSSSPDRALFVLLIVVGSGVALLGERARGSQPPA
jgi:hypothetical protein